MSTVFVSGATGYIAQHVVKQLLAHGYTVIGSVRSAAKGDKLKQLTQSSKFSYEIVPDIAAPGAFDQALKTHPEITTFIHTASPFTFNVNNVETDLLNPAIRGTKNALAAIVKHAPQIQRVVITSSAVAVFAWGKHLVRDKVYTEQDWNPITWEEALEDPVLGYAGSKKYAELTAWEFTRDQQPNFHLSTVNPVFVFGPQAYEIGDRGELNTSVEMINKIIKLRADDDDDIPEFCGRFVDVRDVARAHLVAFEKPEAIGQRLVLVADYFTNDGVANIIRDRFPLVNGPKGDAEKNERLIRNGSRYDMAKTERLLGFEYIPLEQSVVDTVKQIIDA